MQILSQEIHFVIKRFIVESLCVNAMSNLTMDFLLKNELIDYFIYLDKHKIRNFLPNKKDIVIQREIRLSLQGNKVP